MCSVPVEVTYIYRFKFNHFTVDETGHPVVQVQHRAIPGGVAVDILNLQRAGFSRHECIAYLREHLVPPGFQPWPFRRNTPESHLDKMRSLVATYLYRCAIADWQSRGVDFAMYLYIPEVDPTTGRVHHERADHGHLLKRIAGK